MFRSALVALLLMYSIAFADVKIGGKVEYEPHQLVKLVAEGVPAKAAVLWRVDGDVERATTSKDRCEFAAKPGVYRVDLIVIVSLPDGALDLTESRATVLIKSCHQPPAPPGPNPPNPNPPVPPQGSGKLDPENAIGRISFGNAGCSATVIGPRRADGRWDILTAAHCIGAVGQSGKIQMPSNSKVYGVKVVNFDKTCDVAWLVTDDSIVEIEYANLSKDNPPVGTSVWHRGYGVDKPRNKEEGTVAGAENQQGQLRFILNVSSGDSGGGIFRSDTNEVVSTVCCTAIRGAKTDMWGGSTLNALRMRPKPPAAGVEFEWKPCDMEERR